MRAPYNTSVSTRIILFKFTNAQAYKRFNAPRRVAVNRWVLGNSDLGFAVRDLQSLIFMEIPPFTPIFASRNFNGYTAFALAKQQDYLTRTSCPPWKLRQDPESIPDHGILGRAPIPVGPAARNLLHLKHLPAPSLATESQARCGETSRLEVVSFHCNL